SHTYNNIRKFANTRYYLFTEDIIKELEKLQDDVPPFSKHEAKKIIEHELGRSIEELFHTFNENPLAAASIGQVHQGMLFTGENVAIKIQRPEIEEKVHTDLEILNNLASLAEQRVEWASRYQIKDIIEEFSKSLKAELDYTVEGYNAERIAKQFIDDPNIFIPKVYWDFSTKRVLT